MVNTGRQLIVSPVYSKLEDNIRRLKFVGRTSVITFDSVAGHCFPFKRTLHNTVGIKSKGIGLVDGRLAKTGCSYDQTAKQEKVFVHLKGSQIQIKLDFYEVDRSMMNYAGLKSGI